VDAPAPPQSSRASQWLGVVLKGKWRLDTLIGVGGMASVYAATHRNGSRVAIKILNPEYAAQPEFVERFKREGYVANMISHPCSVTVLDDDTEYGCAFIVMDLLSGHSLERYTRRGGPRLPLANILHVSQQVLDLLAVAHTRGILHRDIKPANIHLTAEGLVKVLDFGIARLAQRIDDAAPTQTGAALGTPSYMPPEQARGRWNIVDSRTDLWALGATMHALIVGERPRRSETVQEEMLLAMTTPIPSLRDVAPSTPQPVVTFVERTTAFEMDSRWPDAVTMQAALHQVILAVSSAASSHRGPLHPAESGPNVNPEPGSRSGVQRDTARIVVPTVRPPSERDPMTLHATENTARPTMGGTRARTFLAVAVVVTLASIVGVVARGARPRTADDSTTSAAAPTRAAAQPPSVLPAPAPLPESSVVTPIPTPVAPAVSSVAAAPVPDIELPENPPAPAVANATMATPAAPPSPAAGPAPTSSAHRPSKPPEHRLPNTSSPIFDERF